MKPNSLTPPGIEVLEARIAPASISLLDVDGDLVVIATTKGTAADLDAVLGTSVPMGSVPGGVAITVIDLATRPVFDGTNISVTAKPGPLGGDGFVTVGAITGHNFGTVVVDGNLVEINAGTGMPDSKVKSITCASSSGDSTWDLSCSVGSITVKGDVRGTDIRILGASLGTLTIGGSLLGGDGFGSSGYIHIGAGTMGKVRIGGSILGSAEDNSAVIQAKSIQSVTVGGSLAGGAGLGSGQILATDPAGVLGSVSIGDDLRGGGDDFAGQISSVGSLGPVTIGGSLIGGRGIHAGAIEGTAGIGKVKIGHDVRGGTYPNSGDIASIAGSIASVSIGGDLIGGPSSYSGRIVALGGDLGAVKISGSVIGGSAPAGSPNDPVDSGIIFAQVGTAVDADVANIASITIGGSVIGRGPTSSAQLHADGAIGPVKISGDLAGGAGAGSGSLFAGRSLGLVTLGRSFTAATSATSTFIHAEGDMAGVKIGGSAAGSVFSAVNISSNSGTLAAVAIAGDLIGNSGGAIIAAPHLGTIRIGGDIRGDGGGAFIGANGDLMPISHLVLKSLTVGGSVERLVVNGGFVDHDAQIGTIKVGGDWRASSIYTSVLPGGDGAYGTNDDTAFGVGDPALFTRIASITIGGAIVGTTGPAADHFSFTSQEIGSLRVGGVKIALTPGHGNDSDATLVRYILGATRDFTLHEVS